MGRAVTLDASNAPAAGVSISTILVTDIGGPLRINGNGGPDAVQINDASSPVFVNTGLGDNDNLSVNGDLDGVPVTVIVDQNDDIENLTIFPAETLPRDLGGRGAQDPAGSEPVPGHQRRAGPGRGRSVSRAGGPTPAAFRSQIIAGRNSGAWNGTSTSGAINSSLAASSPLGDSVGYGLGSEIAPTSIDGFAIAAGDTLLRYTLDGDANLDQPVNSLDFNTLVANFGQTGKVWTQCRFQLRRISQHG